MSTEPVEARWRDDNGISDLSVAVDEIYFLRALLADEADILRAHLELKTFPKSRRKFAEEQVERMRLAAAGDLEASRRPNSSSTKAFRYWGIDDTLTNGQWAEQRGLTEANGGESA